MTPDVNVLVAASRQDHPHHVPALAWLESASCTTGDFRQGISSVAASKSSEDIASIERLGDVG